VNTVVTERLAGEVGHPPMVSRKGKTRPSEPGRGKVSPPANPERVTSGASERKDNGVHNRKLQSTISSTGTKDDAPKSQETPVNAIDLKGCHGNQRDHAGLCGDQTRHKNNQEMPNQVRVCRTVTREERIGKSMAEERSAKGKRKPPSCLHLTQIELFVGLFKPGKVDRLLLLKF